MDFSVQVDTAAALCPRETVLSYDVMCSFDLNAEAAAEVGDNDLIF